VALVGAGLWWRGHIIEAERTRAALEAAEQYKEGTTDAQGAASNIPDDPDAVLDGLRNIPD